MAGTGSGARPPKKPTTQNGKTKAFTSVNYKNARLAKEKQRRQYEQQKKEKIVFALFVVVIIVLILIAILVFKKAIDNGEAADTQNDTTTSAPETTNPPEVLDSFLKEMCGKEQIRKGDLILVDAAHPFSATVEVVDVYSGRTKFQNGSKTVYSYYLPDSTPKLSTDALVALNRMADEFYGATGNNDLYVDEAYDASAANGHATGLAFDLSVYTIDHKHYALDDAAASSDFKWVLNNYYKYGFVMETPAQSGERHHHFRYVGIPAATYMFQNNITLSDFLAKLRTEHAFANGETNAASITTIDGAHYELYYVEATGGDMTSVPVPENAIFFSISGDNSGGFVVTARMS